MARSLWHGLLVSVIGRVIAHGAVACLALATVAACSADETGDETVVDWFVVPDRGNQAALADACADASGGAYSVQLHQLPADVGSRHTELVRRLSGASSSIDVLSLDTQLVAEMSGAGFLATVSPAQQQAWSEGVAPGALAASTREGALVAAPWWFDPQLLWFRGVTAERAGLDTTKPITWDDLIAGASRLGVSIQIDDVDGTGMSEWVAGLMAANEGALVTGADGAPVVALDSDAGRGAAAVVEFYRDSSVGPGPQPDATERFAGSGGGFLLAPSSALSDTAMQVIAPELGVAAYPVIADSAPPPAAGVSLAVARDAEDARAASDLISCLIAPEQQRALVLGSGHGAARVATYEDKIVKRDSPTAATVQKSLVTAQPVPPTPYWNTIRRAIDRTWRPISDVSVGGTPKESQREAAAAIRGELP